MKVEHQKNSIASMEMALNELNDQPIMFFQTANEMNVIILK